MGKILLVFLSVLLSCKSEQEIKNTVEKEIAMFLRNFLPKLAEAYKEGSPAPVKEFSSEKFISILSQRILEATDKGFKIEGEVVSFSIENVEVINVNFIVVSTLEEWNLKYHYLSSGKVEKRVGTRYRVHYSFARTGKKWQVLERRILQEITK